MHMSRGEGNLPSAGSETMDRSTDTEDIGDLTFVFMSLKVSVEPRMKVCGEKISPQRP